jgi:hypothetical protein
MRPFNTIKDNLIETINEIIYTILISSLLYLNSKSTWQDYFKYIYISLIMFCSISACLISATSLIIHLINYLKSKISPRKIHPEPSSNIPKPPLFNTQISPAQNHTKQHSYITNTTSTCDLNIIQNPTKSSKPRRLQNSNHLQNPSTSKIYKVPGLPLRF